MDFHCHLDLYPDAVKVYEQTLVRNSFTWLVTTSPRAFEATSRILRRTASLQISPGLHPEIAQEKAAELPLLLMQIPKVLAVGEVGLDGSRLHKPHLQLQRKIFASVLDACCRAKGKVISIHSRGAASDVLDSLEENQKCGTPVLHWFSGTIQELDRAASIGCWFSVGPAMLASANGKKLAERMPLDRVVSESDGPFGKRGGLTLMPWQAMNVCADLAPLWNMSSEAAGGILRSNGVNLISRLRPVGV